MARKPPAKPGPKKREVAIDIDKLPRRKTRKGAGSHTAKEKPWEPTAWQWAMYEAVTRGGSYRTVGAAFGVTHSAVGETCGKIDELLALQYMDKIRRLRVRHTKQLEVVIDEAFQAWERSKAVGVTETVETEGVTQPDGTAAPTGLQKKKRQERHQCGDPSYLSEVRSSLADIRRIWSVDKNPRVAEIESGEEYRVAGKPREQVIEEQIVRLTASLLIAKAVTVVES